MDHNMKLSKAVKMKSLMNFIFMLILMLTANKVAACSAVTDRYYINHEKMIENSKGIYLVKAISKELNNKIITTTFEVLETIKGTNNKNITVSFPDFEYERDISASFMNDFNLHTNESFWNAGSGRSKVLTGCETIASFKLGYVYLVFPEHTSNAKGLEITNDTSDKWYQYVKEKVKIQL